MCETNSEPERLTSGLRRATFDITLSSLTLGKGRSHPRIGHHIYGALGRREGLEAASRLVTVARSLDGVDDPSAMTR